MFIPTLVMAVLAVILLTFGYLKGGGEHVAGLQLGFKMTYQVLPLLIFAFIVAGMAQVLLPKELIANWIGAESGFRGILIGTVAGAFAPGGPYVSMPLAAGFLKAGAGIGTMVAFLTAWSVIGVSRVPMEIGIMGWQFTLIRLTCCFFFPPIAGLIAQTLFGR